MHRRSDRLNNRNDQAYFPALSGLWGISSKPANTRCCSGFDMLEPRIIAGREIGTLIVWGLGIPGNWRSDRKIRDGLRHLLSHPKKKVLNRMEDGLHRSSDHRVVAPRRQTTAICLKTHAPLFVGKRNAKLKGYSLVNRPPSSTATR